jgi:hypothetical protein
MPGRNGGTIYFNIRIRLQLTLLRSAYYVNLQVVYRPGIFKSKKYFFTA